MNVLPRTKPSSVRYASFVNPIARLDGADTAATTGTPATMAFLGDFERCPPANEESVRGERQTTSGELRADDLVDGVVTAHVLGDLQ